VGAESFQADRHDEVRFAFHNFTNAHNYGMNFDGNLINWFVVIFHSLLLPPKTLHYSTWNCFHTVVRSCVRTYSVPRFSIRYSQRQNVSVYTYTNCHPTMATETVKKQYNFYLFGTI